MGLGLQRTPHLEDSGLRPSVVTRQEGKVRGDDLGMAEEKCFPTMQKKWAVGLSLQQDPCNLRCLERPEDCEIHPAASPPPVGHQRNKQ